VSDSKNPSESKALDSVIAYPIDFPIKIMGPNHPAFVETMTHLVRRHAEDFDPQSASSRPSREGKYLSLTVTIRATSREQLDAIYQALSDHPMVSMAL
jgi:uncharacterized protein